MHQLLMVDSSRYIRSSLICLCDVTMACSGQPHPCSQVFSVFSWSHYALLGYYIPIWLKWNIACFKIWSVTALFCSFCSFDKDKQLRFPNGLIRVYRNIAENQLFHKVWNSLSMVTIVKMGFLLMRSSNQLIPVVHCRNKPNQVIQVR